ncbi:MAG: Holliday junction branch migration protein RuvA [Rhodobacteraceae bacterium]|nr:Holliday junction branch migration protein RuvA [Paracoccaceae bacterium]
MIGKISGRLDWKGQGEVLIDCRGVGYIVHVNDRTLAAMPPVGEAVALFTDLLVREDLLQLFGFPTMVDKEWHRLLTTVQGVGAKAAMAILGTLGAEGVARAITLGDARAVQAAPGVGPKLAQRVILELKAKAPSVMAMGARLQDAALVIEPVEPPAGPAARRSGGKTAPPPAAPSAAQMRAGYAADALSALMNLGYGQGDAAEAVAIAGGEAPEADTAALILLALKRLAPR